jgi:hypothetical protein
MEEKAGGRRHGADCFHSTQCFCFDGMLLRSLGVGRLIATGQRGMKLLLAGSRNGVAVSVDKMGVEN